MTRTTGRVAGVALLAGLVLAGCGSATTPGTQGTARPATAVPSSPTAADVRAHVDDVELVVAGSHVQPADPQAAGLGTIAGVPVDRVVQLHLVLLLRNTGTQPRAVGSDALELAVGGAPALAAAPGTFPPDPLAPGSETETGAAFDVVVGAGAGSPVLRWTHLGRTRLLPVGQVGATR